MYKRCNWARDRKVLRCAQDDGWVYARIVVIPPSTTIDWSLDDGVGRIPIEHRDTTEVSHLRGRYEGRTLAVQSTADDTAIANPAFDVTPARLVTGLITERGVCDASRAGLASLFPEHAAA